MARLKTRLKRIESEVTAQAGKVLVFFEDPHDPDAATLRDGRVFFEGAWTDPADLPAGVTAVLVKYVAQ